MLFVELTISLIVVAAPYSDKISKDTQQNFIPMGKKLLVCVELSQQYLKWEAGGAERNYSSSPALDSTAAGRSCPSRQPQLPKELS